MKKGFTAFLLAGVIALSFAVPVAATEVTAAEPINPVAEQGISPHTEMTQIAWRTYHGQLQFRVWSITNGRWLTDWTNVYLL